MATQRVTRKDAEQTIVMLDQERTDDVKKARTPRAKRVTNPVTAKSPADGKERLAAAKRRVARSTTVAPKTTAAKSVKAKVGQTKAERARVLFRQGKTVLEVSKALPDVTWAYAWDIKAAMDKKDAKVAASATIATTTAGKAASA
jgi:hypothetical protein